MAISESVKKAKEKYRNKTSAFTIMLRPSNKDDQVLYEYLQQEMKRTGLTKSGILRKIITEELTRDF